MIGKWVPAKDSNNQCWLDIRWDKDEVKISEHKIRKVKENPLYGVSFLLTLKLDQGYNGFLFTLELDGEISNIRCRYAIPMNNSISKGPERDLYDLVTQAILQLYSNLLRK